MSETLTLETARARERFLTGDSGPELAVRSEILASWRRSVMHGLTPAEALPRGHVDESLDSQLLRAARPVVESRRSALTGAAVALTLTDQEGRLLSRWVEDTSFARRLDSRQVLPGMCISEVTVGTNSSGIALETGHAAIVVGHEHFSAGAVMMTSAGAPIRHPVTRRIVGSLNLTCAVEDTNPLLLPWVAELVNAIEHRLLEGSSWRQRRLFDAFLTSARDARHPTICLDEDTVITNAAAARILDASDHALVWEVAARQLDGTSAHGEPLALSTGWTVEVACQPVTDGDVQVGALVHLTVVRDRPTSADRLRAVDVVAPSLDGLVGRSAAWTRFLADTRRAWSTRRAVLITGEAGTGKSDVAFALLRDSGGSLVLDAGDLQAGEWSAKLNAALHSAPPALVLKRVDLLNADDYADTCRLLRDELPARTRVVATARASEDSLSTEGLMGWPGALLTAPPLRDRLDDLPELLATMTNRACGGNRGPRWSAEVVQLLGRVEWPTNLWSLHALVGSVAPACRGPVVKPDDLPAQWVVRGSRRSLIGLEQMEAHAITNALRAAGGNKREAADALGIARSTLYRKVRALGLDLSTTTG